eukprot:5177939-Prymnesium_polylepis.1
MQMKALQAALQEALPNIIAIAWQPYAGTHHLHAVVADILARMRHWKMRPRASSTMLPAMGRLQGIVPSSSVEVVERSKEAIMNALDMTSMSTPEATESVNAAATVRRASAGMIGRVASRSTGAASAVQGKRLHECVG